VSLERIRGMRDLEAQNLRTLPERIAMAQRNGMVGDEQLCELMGWKLDHLADIKTGERKPTPSEMRALYGVFGKSAGGLLRTRYRKGQVPPRKPADWVILGDRAEQTELDRLRAENRLLQAQLAEARAELKRYQDQEAGLDRIMSRLQRARGRPRSAAPPPVDGA
jgi:transcriptional regulator with XRE-family HTH domain